MKRGKPKNPDKKNFSEQGENQKRTLPTWRRQRESNPGHISGRRTLPPLPIRTEYYFCIFYYYVPRTPWCYIHCYIGHFRGFILYFKASSGKVFVMNINPHSYWSNYRNKNFTLWLALKKTEGNSEVAYCLDKETSVLRLHLLCVHVVSTWSTCIYNLDGFYSQVAICADPPGFKRINWRVA